MWKKRNEAKSNVVGINTYGDFLIAFNACSEDHKKELVDKLNKIERPNFIGKIEVPINLNMMTYGQLDDLGRSASAQDPFAECFKIVLGIEQKDVYQINLFDVFGFCNFVKSELDRINKLFANIDVKHSSDEIAAGVKDLNFGSFGVIDWYARRMGITNQDEVYSVGWIRIFTCMKNDADQNNYERRLQEQSMRKIKHK